MSRGTVWLRVCTTKIFCLAILAVGFAQIDTVHAQSYPTKTIKMIVPFGPGGPTDVAARIVANFMQSKLGQNVIVENRPGAGSAIGTRVVAAAEPDGYTLLFTSTTFGVVPAVVKDPGYDPLKTFVPVAKVSDSALVIVIPPSIPAKSVQELIAYVKANPGKLSFPSAGVGSFSHLVPELFKAKNGLDATHIPYKSGAEIVTSLLSVQTHFAFPEISYLISHLQEGRLRPLAVTSSARHPQLPNVPTTKESGLADFQMTFWSGVLAPAGTPAAIVDKLNSTINEGLNSPEIQSVFAKTGAQVSPGRPEVLAKFLSADMRNWNDAAKSAGMSKN